MSSGSHRKSVPIGSPDSCNCLLALTLCHAIRLNWCPRGGGWRPLCWLFRLRKRNLFMALRLTWRLFASRSHLIPDSAHAFVLAFKEPHAWLPFIYEVLIEFCQFAFWMSIWTLKYSQPVVFFWFFFRKGRGLLFHMWRPKKKGHTFRGVHPAPFWPCNHLIGWAGNGWDVYANYVRCNEWRNVH